MAGTAGRTRRGAVAVAALALTTVAPAGLPATPAGAGPLRTGTAAEVRQVWTGELGLAHPTDLAYSAARHELLVAEAGASQTTVLRTDFDEHAVGSTAVATAIDPGSLAVDERAGALTGVSASDRIAVRVGDLTTASPAVARTPISAAGLGDTHGAAHSAADGAWYVLDGGQDLVRITGTPAAATRVSLRGLGAARLAGLAFNANDGLLYVASPDRDRLYGLDGTGATRKVYDLSTLPFADIAAITFAPSSDTTDDPARLNLFVADPGTGRQSGSITEATLTSSAVTLLADPPPTVTTTLVQTIATSAFTPGSPDPSGVTWINGSGRDRLEIADSEVDETTGAGWHGVNLWQIERTGAVRDTGTTSPTFSNEPTGLGFDRTTSSLFVSDDDNSRVWVVKPGPDGRWGNSDDVRTFINTGALGLTDTEDPAFDNSTGHLYFLDGVSTEIWRVDPRNGVFGDGDDVATHFDVGVLGITDTEALAYREASNTLIVGDRSKRKLFEITKTGTLLRTIDASATPGLSNVSGLTLAPATNDPTRMDLWIVDRAVDNGPSPSENDGKLFELSAVLSPPADSAPSVTLTAPAAGSTVSGASVAVTATASDDNGVMQVQFFDGTTSIGTDTNGADGWTATWNTTTAAEGAHTVRATATDTAGQTATDTHAVTVDNDTAPTVAFTAPAAGSTVAGASVAVTANASDDKGVTQVQFFDGTTGIGTDTNGADGWSVTWNTTTATEGAHTLRATATDTIGQTATTTRSVNVDNVDDLPTATLTAPAANAVVSGASVTVSATAADDKGVTQVQFFDGTTGIGTDTNGADGWSVTWNTTTATDGAHTLTARATDTINQVGDSPTRVVTVDNTAPLVAVSSPAAGSSVSGNVTVTAAASDNDAVASVTFLVDGAAIGTDTNGADGWSVVWNSFSSPNGPHDLQARATDRAGWSTTSAIVSVGVNNQVVNTLDVAVAAGADDAEQNAATGGVNLTSADLDLTLDGTTQLSWVGMRFAGVSVPAGMQITNAYVQFRADETHSGATSLTIQGQAADSAAGFTTVANNLSSRPRTTASVAWSPSAWSVNEVTAAQRTPNLAPVLQEIIGRSGWASGNAIALLITGSGQRVADAFEGSWAPVLHIEYTAGDPKPTVSWTQPAAGSTVSGTAVTLAANASDDQLVTQVQFSDGATPIATDTDGADGWSVTWDTTAATDGGHTLQATATDNAGQTTSATRTVTVDNVDEHPTATLTAPAAGAVVTGAAVAVTATAGDDRGVSQVEFFDGFASIGVDTDGADGWSVTWDTTPASENDHTLIARATDTANQTTDSAAHVVTVDNTAPSATISSPQAGTTVSGLMTVTASASDNDVVTSVTFLVDGAAIGTDSTGADGWSVAWNTFTSPNGPHDLQARATDRAGLTATSAIVFVGVSNSGSGTLDIPVASGPDDVEERTSNGNVNTTSSDLDILLDNATAQSWVGLRFTGLSIPAGATITNAYVQFRADESQSVATALTVYAQAADSAPSFPTTRYGVSTRPRTTASVAWSPGAWTVNQVTAAQRTPSLAAVVQEVVNRDGWTPGNAIAVLITGSGQRVADAYEGNWAPVLHVEYAYG